jgi:hypothetical protein
METGCLLISGMASDYRVRCDSEFRLVTMCLCAQPIERAMRRASNGSAKYCVSRATFAPLNSMMLTV